MNDSTRVSDHRRPLLLGRSRTAELWYAGRPRLWCQQLKQSARRYTPFKYLTRKRLRNAAVPMVAGNTLAILPRDVGFFSLFNQVLGSLQYCAQHRLTPRVHFVSGPYVDTQIGPNWWEYYFEPVDRADTGVRAFDQSIALNEMAARAADFDAFAKVMSMDGIGMSPLLAHRYIAAHIKLRSAIAAKVDAFHAAHMSGRYVIGVQYRGTDKVLEAPRVPHEFVLAELQRQLQRQPTAVVFVATDDQQLLELVIAKHGDRVIYWDSLRSSDSVPVHDAAFAGEPYKKGEDVLIDCLLLARCDLLLLTRSNVSVSALQFNPWLNFRDLTRRYTMLHRGTS